MITIEKQPYEFLVRWRDGKLSGAHIQFIERKLADGEKVSETVGNPMPVGSADFPLQDILDLISANAVTALATVAAERDAALASLAALQLKHDSVVSAVVSGDAKLISAKVSEVTRTEKQRKAAELEKEIAELQVKLAESKRQ